MPGTFGKSDIWFVYIYDNEEYSQPINLGPNVNTEFRESFPFIDDSFNLFTQVMERWDLVVLTYFLPN